MQSRMILPVAVLVSATAPAAETHWVQLPPIPDQLGVAGSFAGVCDGRLLVAGGANFPDKKPWEGGKKVWHETVFTLDEPGGKWVVAGALPRPLGYGVSVTHRDGIICVGGSDATRHYADAFRLDVKAGRLVTTPLPSLPHPLANACGALLGETLYVAGGQESADAADALKSCFALDLAAAKPEWRKIDDLPGAGRILSVAAACDGAFWVIGGAALVSRPDGKVERQYLTDAYRYDPSTGWRRVADLPEPVVAAPSPAGTRASGPVIFGGDNGKQVGIAPQQHRGFSRRVLRYDLSKGEWRADADGELPAPRVTTPLVQWRGMWVIPSGEATPGVRSPQVWAASGDQR